MCTLKAQANKSMARQGIVYKERAGGWDSGNSCIFLESSTEMYMWVLLSKDGFRKTFDCAWGCWVGALIGVCCPLHLLCKLSVATAFQSPEGSGNWIFWAGFPTTMLKDMSCPPREKSMGAEQAESVALVKDQALRWLPKLIMRDHWIYRSPL